LTTVNYPFFVSQREQKLYPDVGCGVACLLMLLQAKNIQRIPTWTELVNELQLDQSPLNKGYSLADPPIGLYPEDLLKYVVHHKLRFRIHFYEHEWQDCLRKAPIMVLMQGILEDYPDEDHWVVLVGYENNGFSYLDPWQLSTNSYIKQVSKDEFMGYYTGIALQIW
jgi:hypothetical protein